MPHQDCGMKCLIYLKWRQGISEDFSNIVLPNSGGGRRRRIRKRRRNENVSRTEQQQQYGTGRENIMQADRQTEQESMLVGIYVLADVAVIANQKKFSLSNQKQAINFKTEWLAGWPGFTSQYVRYIAWLQVPCNHWPQVRGGALQKLNQLQHEQFLSLRELCNDKKCICLLFYKHDDVVFTHSPTYASMHAYRDENQSLDQLFGFYYYLLLNRPSSPRLALLVAGWLAGWLAGSQSLIVIFTF